MSNILVTGGMGFIGHNVVSRLESLGHTVYIADNMTNYGIIPYSEISYLMDERKKKVKTYWHYKYDIYDYENMHWLFASGKFDIVIHMASFPRQKVVNNDPIGGSKIMIESLINLLQLSKKFDVKKFVYISSSMVYGDFSDDTREDTVCNPEGAYGIMKFTGEMLVKDYARNSDMKYTIIRPSAVYGPLDVEDRVVSKFMLDAMRGDVLKVRGGDERLDFTYVDDVADGIVGATLSENADNNTFNITKSNSRTLLEAAELIVKIVGSGTIEVCDKDENFPSRGSLNTYAARYNFGYNPKIDIEQGFRLYYDWLKNSTFYNINE